MGPRRGLLPGFILDAFGMDMGGDDTRPALPFAILGKQKKEPSPDYWKKAPIKENDFLLQLQSRR